MNQIVSKLTQLRETSFIWKYYRIFSIRDLTGLESETRLFDSYTSKYRKNHAVSHSIQNFAPFYSQFLTMIIKAGQIIIYIHPSHSFYPRDFLLGKNGKVTIDQIHSEVLSQMKVSSRDLIVSGVFNSIKGLH